MNRAPSKLVDACPPAEAAGGHFVSAGVAIASMGVVALVAAIVLDRVLGIELGFISASAMRNIGLIDLALGGLMVAHGRLSHDEP